MANTMHKQALYHHDCGETRLATVLMGAAESIRERPTPKNVSFCTSMHQQYCRNCCHDSIHQGEDFIHYWRNMDVYIKTIQAQAPVMARILRSQAKCGYK
mmetsp:Transcript_2152/g.3096  ORF Transcript_2152/g.3096 Transcript_2152/m.3096 type:complete len:100 (+) Transcript_2152:662-961(+)